jgi:hypothetical protein
MASSVQAAVRMELTNNQRGLVTTRAIDSMAINAREARRHSLIGA